MTPPLSLPGFSFLMDLTKLAHDTHPERAQRILAAWIEQAELAGVDPFQVRLARRRLAVFRGEQPEVTMVAWGG